MDPGVPHLDLKQLAAPLYVTRTPCEPRTICVTEACPKSMLRTVPWCVEDFVLHKQLYKGKASLLYSATCKSSQIPIALKLYRKEKLSNLNWFQVEREIRIHSQIKHKAIIQLFASFEDSENIYLAQEFATGGDLYEEMKAKGGKLEEARVAASIVLPCLEALAYLHGLGIIHRDIKSENILLMGDGQVKLADFGLSINYREERPVTRAGTLDMMAPEVLVCPEKSRPEENKERAMLAYTEAVDAWAMGIVAFELLVGHPPFERESRSETYEHIMYRAPVLPAAVSEDAKRFITLALIKAVTKRPSVVELLQHTWLQKHLELIPASLPSDSLSEESKRTEDVSAKTSLTLVNITIDCTVRAGNPCSSEGSNLSSSGSADNAEVAKRGTDDVKGSSVLQWANSSLKSITGKLSKPILQPLGLPLFQQRATPRTAGPSNSASETCVPESLLLATATSTTHFAAPDAVDTDLGLSSSSPAAPSEVLRPLSSPRHLLSKRGTTDAMRHTQTEEATRSQPSSFSSSLVATEASVPAVRRSSRLGSLPAPNAKAHVASSRSHAHKSLRPLRLTPPTLSHSLASLVLGDPALEETPQAQRRRSLLANKSTKEANLLSPPAYLSRPWATQRVPKGSPESPSNSPKTPALVRRRRCMAGNVDSSSSGSMSLADTPKGGHFPSGAHSARSFGRAVVMRQMTGSCKRANETAPTFSSTERVALPDSPPWCSSPSAKVNLTARPEQGNPRAGEKRLGGLKSSTLERAVSVTARSRAARKLDLKPGDPPPESEHSLSQTAASLTMRPFINV